MPKVIYDVPSFGGWVKKVGFPPDMKCQVTLREKDVPTRWNVTIKGRILSLVAILSDESAEILSPDVYEVVFSLAVQFENLFVSDHPKDDISINCHFPKLAKNNR